MKEKRPASWIPKGMIRAVWTLILLASLASIGSAQQPGTMVIIVRDSSALALSSATVIVSNQSKAISRSGISDENGLVTFTDLPADSNYCIRVSFVGLSPQQRCDYILSSGQRATIIFELDGDASASMDEVVVVGYGTQAKTSVTSAVSTMKGEEVSQIPITSISNGLGGRLAGVITRQSSGEPGRDDAEIYIRGVSTTGSAAPLLIVDGIPRDFRKLDPNTIESITVLKDAAAVAPYGVAGANGVILVTTKRGISGEPTLSYNAYVGFQNPTGRLEHVSPYEFAQLKNLAARNVGETPPYNDHALQKFQDGTEPDVFPVDDVWHAIANNNALLTNHNIEVRGGGERATYYASLGYMHHQGMWKTTGENKYNLALAIDASVSNTTKLAFNLNGRLQKDWYPPIGTARIMELYGYSHPARGGALVFSNGMYGKFIMGSVYNDGYARENTTALFSSLTLTQELPFIEGLKFKGTVAYDPTYDYNKTWLMPVQLATIDTTKRPYEIKDGVFGQAKPSLSESFSRQMQLTFQASLDYSRSFGKHNVSALALFESKANDWNTFRAGRTNYDLAMDELSMGSSNAAHLANSGSSSLGRQVGVVYRVVYGFNGKYLFEASGRYDGSYYFAPGKRFGFFPAFSAGWRLSEERFMENVRWVDNLKIRGSYGEVGALAGSAFQYLTSYGVTSPAYAFGGNAVQSTYERLEPNPDITWERARKTDIGIEASLWRGKLRFEADYFYEKRSNMLVTPNVIVPDEYGVSLSQVNAGVMENRGFELTMASNHQLSADLSVGVGGNITFAKNKVLEVFESPNTLNNPNLRRTGRPLGSGFGYQALGYFQEEDFDDSGNLNAGIPVQSWGAVSPGDIRYADLNGDGKINNDDRTYIHGSPIPGIIYGISANASYRGFQLDVLLQGAGDRDFYIQGEGAWLFFNGMGAFTHNLDYWTPENRNAANPRPTPSPTSNNSQVSSFWVNNVAYLRLKNVTLSYSLPSGVLDRLKLGPAQVYLSGQNFATWSNIKRSLDPELANSYARDYPTQIVYSLGFNITF